MLTYGLFCMIREILGDEYYYNWDTFSDFLRKFVWNNNFNFSFCNNYSIRFNFNTILFNRLYYIYHC